MMLFLWRGLRKARSLAGGWFTVAMLRSQGATLRGRPRFLSSTYVRYPKAVSIGSNCLIGRDVVIGSEAKGSRLTIGDSVQINDRVQLDHTGDLVIGDRVLISSEVIVSTHSHGHDPRSVPAPYPKVIADGAWIGMRAIILPSCRRIGEGAIVAAASVVTHDVPDYVIVAGNPARVIGPVGSGEAEIHEAG